RSGSIPTRCSATSPGMRPTASPSCGAPAWSRDAGGGGGAHAMIVSVLGGGNGGFAAAADLALNGHRVRLWRRTGTELTAIRESGGITLIAEVGQDTGRLEAATANMDDALAGAEVIVVAVPATAHDDIGPALGKRLHND